MKDDTTGSSFASSCCKFTLLTLTILIGTFWFLSRLALRDELEPTFEPTFPENETEPAEQVT